MTIEQLEALLAQKHNPVVGEGLASHAVPLVPMRTVLMADSGHRGTLVTRLEDQSFAFASLDYDTVATAPRCLLVRLGDEVSYDVVPDHSGDAFGISVEQVTLALIGCELDEDMDVPAWKVLWDSKPQYALTAKMTEFIQKPVSGDNPEALTEFFDNGVSVGTAQWVWNDANQAWNYQGEGWCSDALASWMRANSVEADEVRTVAQEALEREWLSW